MKHNLLPTVSGWEQRGDLDHLRRQKTAQKLGRKEEAGPRETVVGRANNSKNIGYRTWPSGSRCLLSVLCTVACCLGGMHSSESLGIV